MNEKNLAKARASKEAIRARIMLIAQRTRSAQNRNRVCGKVGDLQPCFVFRSVTGLASIG